MSRYGSTPLAAEKKSSVSIAAVCGFAALAGVVGLASYELGFQSQTASAQLYSATAVRPATRVAPAAVPMAALTPSAQQFAGGMFCCPVLCACEVAG